MKTAFLFQDRSPYSFSPNRFVAFIKLSVTSQMWRANRLRQQAEREEPEHSTWEPLCCPTDTDVWECQSLLPWRTAPFTRPLCLFRLSWWHSVPESPAVALWTCGESERRVLPPPLSKKGNQVMTEKLGEEREVSRLLCTVCHTSHGQDSAHVFRRAWKLGFQGRSFSFDGGRTKMLLTTLFFKEWLYFSSGNIQRCWLKSRLHFFLTWVV